MSLLDVVNPRALGVPRGYSNGLVAPAGSRLLFVAGQTAADDNGELPTGDFACQFDVALERSVAVVKAAGGGPEHIARMAVYVTDVAAYRESRGQLADIWRQRMGSHYPAMVLVEVTSLVDRDAMVEIEATAVLPPEPTTEPLP